MSRHERIRAHNDRLAAAANRQYGDGSVPFLCECDDDACDRFLGVSAAQFSRWGPSLRVTVGDHTISGGVFAGTAEGCSLYLVRSG